MQAHRVLAAQVNEQQVGESCERKRTLDGTLPSPTITPAPKKPHRVGRQTAPSRPIIPPQDDMLIRLQHGRGLDEEYTSRFDYCLAGIVRPTCRCATALNCLRFRHPRSFHRLQLLLLIGRRCLAYQPCSSCVLAAWPAYARTATHRRICRFCASQ